MNCLFLIQKIKILVTSTVENTINTQLPKKPERTRITFNDESDSPTKRKSILERLGKRRSNESEELPSNVKKNRISVSEFRKDEDSSKSREKDGGKEKRSRSSLRSKGDNEKPKEVIVVLFLLLFR
jgi:hypothetical protein